MKYAAPDYEVVSLRVNNLFASNYLQTGCPEDEYLVWNYTRPCEGTPDYRQEADTYTGLGWGTGCYSTHNP